MLVISLNGPDNVGKTTQLRLLRAGRPDIPDLGGIHRYGNDWPGLQPGQFSRWWFSDSSPSELIRTVSNAFRARSQAIPLSSSVVVLDRGSRQFESVLIATIMIKESATVERARQLVRDVAGDLFTTEPSESLRVMLTHGSDATDSVNLSLAREEHVSDTYGRYQRLLQELLYEQVDAGCYDVVLHCHGKSILEIQNSLRAALSTVTPPFLPILDSVRTVYAFGGLSESGKSTAAQYLNRRHGVTRLKISYLLELAAMRHHIADIYALTEPDLAELLVLELDHFARRQYYLPAFSIESLHRLEMTGHLKRLLGDRLVIAYCEAQAATRFARARDTQGSVSEKDAVKTSRGAHDIKAVADVVLDNESTLLHLYRQLDKIFIQATTSEVRPKVTSLDHLGLPPDYQTTAANLLDDLTTSLGSHLAIFAIIGSWGRKQGANEVSDLDILVVVDSAGSSVMREAVLHSVPLVKLGLTVVTSEELDRLVVDSKAFHALRLITRGELAVQFLRADYMVPVVADIDDLADSLAYLPSVIQRLRRELLKIDPDAREIGKVCFLMTKIVLRAQGVELDDRESAFECLNSYYPQDNTSDLHLLATAAITAVGQRNAPDVLEAAKRFLHWVESFSANTEHPQPLIRRGVGDHSVKPPC